VELREVMTSTPTIRYYTPEPVDDETLRRVLDVARFAPSGGNRQGWRVVVVRAAAMRRQLHDLYQIAWAPHRQGLSQGERPNQKTQLRSLGGADHFADNLYTVPVLLIVCVDLAALQITDAQLERPSIVGGASIYPFTQNLLLAARDQGLGVALTTLICSQEAAVKQLLAIPDGYAVAALVALGHPDPAHVPIRLRRRAVDEFAFADSFGRPLRTAPLSR
jgi:nitroreductase